MEIRFDWPRIHDSVLFETARGEKVAQVAAREIEALIERDGTPRGEPLGTSPELCERFGIGRETLLEAARLLEDRGIARMRRGPHGGLFSLGKPVVDLAAALHRYLLGAGITIDQVREARSVLSLLNIYDHQVRRGGDAQLDAGLGGLLGEGGTIQHVPGGWTDPAPGPCLKPFVDALDDLLAAKLACDEEGDARGPGLVGIAVDYLTGEVNRMRRLGMEKLGSETQMADRIGVSRQVLRQAIRLLEDQGLIICRRGRSNGIVTAAAHPAGIVRSLGDGYARSGLTESGFRHILGMLDRINRTLFAAKADQPGFIAIERMIQQKEWRNPATHIRRMHVEWPVINNPALSLLEQALSGYRARRAGTHVFVAISDVEGLRRSMLEHVDLMRVRNLAGADRRYVEMHGQITVLLDGH